MEFRILGPLEVLVEGRTLALGGSKPRALLALLLLHRGETLGTERLIDELWGERPPATAAKSLRVHVSRLRRALSPEPGERRGELVVTHGHGYRLVLDPERLDAYRFERLLAEGRSELAAGRPERAASALEEGLSLWRGRPLDDLAYEPFAQREIARLEDLHVAAIGELVDARLALGRHAEVVAQLEPLIAEHPYRERLRGQLMLALYRCDRQAEALQAYQDARRTLVEELGIEPSERLRELERAILAQDRALAAPATVPATGDDREASSPPAEQPTGVVTFLLTDIEGSSGMWESDAGAMAAALELHDELIAGTVEAHGGWLLKAKGEGDATLTVFLRASDAVACAVKLQRALHGAAWPGGLDVRVRVALHTGEAHEREGDYFGPALNRAARLRSLARGGATVMSQATAEIVQERLPPEIELVELGRQELRGLSRPENVFELRGIAEAVLAGESALDAPRTTAAGGPDALGGPPAPPTARLPAPLTRTIGREAERAAIAQQLGRGEIRLVTLTGPGGVGKTRLATEIATVLGARWRDGWRFVSLASLQAAEQVETTLAEAFEVVFAEGERPREALARWLATRELLLVIDNFEHLLAAAPLVSELLDASPGLTVLATSREPLHLRGEHVARVAGLSDEDGTELFLERARDHDPDLEPDDTEREAIVAMCRRLDGLPLAIELTAPWISLLPISQLASRLQEPLAILDRGARDAPARQRTLRATIDWSYNLLDDDARSAFAALAVFPGDCTIEAAQAIGRASLHALAALEAKSLIARRGERLVMLETIRDYAAERLAERADADEIRSRHARHFLTLAEDGEAGLDGPDWVVWRRRLDAEIDNFRAAFAWLVATRRVDSALALASAQQPFWRRGWHDREIRRWLNTALSLADDTTPPGTRARALLASSRGALLASLRFSLLDPEQAERDATAALELYRQLDDLAGIAESLVSLGYREVCLGRYREASALAGQALDAARASRDERAIGWALWLRATAGEGFDEVRSLAREAVVHFRNSGATRRIYPLLNTAAYAAIEDARYSEALPLLDEALPAARAADDAPGIAIIRGNEAVAHLMLTNDQQATDALSEQLGLCRDLSLDRTVEEALLCTAAIAAHRGARRDAGLLAGAATTRFENRRRMAVEELVFRRIQDQHLRHVRDTDPRTWDAAARAGGTLSDHDAIDVALRVLERRPPRATIEPSERLRELERAILAQGAALAIPESPQSAPPPRPRAALPSPPTRTVGRDEDRAAVSALLREEEVRLVTLTGAGGVGKTRLALVVAFALESELPDGAWFVSLASTSSAEHVPSTIAQALGVTPQEGETPKAALERFLAAKRGLLVLDNFEHLLPAAPLVGDLLTACATLMVLATSREPLHLQAEQRYVVDPLQVPADAGPPAVERAAAGTLFVERARSHDRRFALTEGNAGSIGEICRRLDGLPLAIELAAARTPLLGAEELNARLGQALDVLGTGPLDAPDRQRTLRATIEWSHRLLSAPEAEAFARFAVFAGGATIEAAQRVTGADLDALEGLIDKQLLRRNGSVADTRLLMLETVREYAQERLDADENAAEIHRLHCRHYLDLAERAEPELYTRGEAEWLVRLDAETDNLRAALDWSLRREPSLALRLAGLLVWFWEIRNRLDEGLEWLAAALDAAGDAAPIADRARARRAQVNLLAGKGSAYDSQGSMKDARARASEALALSRQAGDPAGIADALLGLAQFEVAESLPQPRRRALAEEALVLAREGGDDRLVAGALRHRALALSAAQGSAELDAAVAALRKIGNPRELVGLYSDAAYNAIKEGKPERASHLLEQAMPLARDLGDPVALALVCGNLGLEALFSGDLDRSRAAFDEQLRICREHVLWFAAEGLSGLAALAARRDDLEQAARLLGAATAIGGWDADADVGVALEQQFFEPARQRYGERRWSEAYAAGACLGFVEAIDLALSPEADRG